MSPGKRGIAGALTLVFGGVWTVLIALGISGSQTSPAHNSAKIEQLPNFVAEPKPSETATPWARKPIGFLSAPSAQILDLPITRGIDIATLNTGMAGAYPWSGPGQPGVFAIAAHRIGAGGPFRYLDQINIGDRLYVEADGKRFTYRVFSDSIVEPTDTWVLNGPKDDSRIVLITCTPLNNFKQRIVVTARLIPETQ